MSCNVIRWSAGGGAVPPTDPTQQRASTGGGGDPRPVGASPSGAAPPPGTPPPSGVHEPPPGAGLMNVVRWALFAVLILLAVGSIGGYLISHRAPKGAASTQKARWYCPMHPTYTSDRPGECPICGMSLEPMPKDEGAAPSAQAGAGGVAGLADVHLSPDRVQLIGVRLARVERRPLGGQLDLVGFVTPDESRLRRVQLRVSGWVERLFVSRTGDRVLSGEPLLSIYSPELYQSEREYLIERGVRDSMPGMAGMSHEAGAEQSAEQRLRLLGVPSDEITRLSRDRTAEMRLTLRSPVSGTVLERGVVEGQYVGADTPLLTVADLSEVWVLADVYEMDVSRVHAGDRAQFTSDALPGRTLEARVGFVYPTVSSETRTVKVRLEITNPGGVLRPGMFGRVRVQGGGAPTLVIPGEAVVSAGDRSYVFLARGGGHFEPRVVETGLRAGDDVQILRGLAEGDTVVSSASFLIDSESRLKAAIEGMGGAGGRGKDAPPPGHRHGDAP